jgi:hypothetical protein
MVEGKRFYIFTVCFFSIDKKLGMKLKKKSKHNKDEKTRYLMQATIVM